MRPLPHRPQPTLSSQPGLPWREGVGAGACMPPCPPFLPGPVLGSGVEDGSPTHSPLWKARRGGSPS